MNRKRMVRRMRRKLMNLGTILREEVLNRNDDGTKIPDKREWGYCVEILVNGHNIICPYDSWYEAYKGALCAAEWAVEQEPFVRREVKGLDEA